MTETEKEASPIAQAPTKVEITLRGREYTIVCDPNEQEKLKTIVAMVEEKLNDVSSRGTNNSEVRTFMLASLVLADELVETRKLTAQNRKEDESLMVAAVDHLRERLTTITEKIGEN